MGTMMIYTIFSDLQGNFDAVTQFFRETEGRVTTYLCLGDIVQDGKTHDGSRVIDLLREHAVIGVQGNHDAELLKKRDEALQKISHENLEYLAALPETRSVNGFHLVHAPGGRRILDRADAELVFSELPADVKILLFGHSHQPVVFRSDKRGRIQNELTRSTTRFIKRKFLILGILFPRDIITSPRKNRKKALAESSCGAHCTRQRKCALKKCSR